MNLINLLKSLDNKPTNERLKISPIFLDEIMSSKILLLEITERNSSYIFLHDKLCIRVIKQIRFTYDYCMDNIIRIDYIEENKEPKNIVSTSEGQRVF